MAIRMTYTPYQATAELAALAGRAQQAVREQQFAEQEAYQQRAIAAEQEMQATKLAAAREQWMTQLSVSQQQYQQEMAQRQEEFLRTQALAEQQAQQQYSLGVQQVAANRYSARQQADIARERLEAQVEQNALQLQWEQQKAEKNWAAVAAQQQWEQLRDQKAYELEQAQEARMYQTLLHNKELAEKEQQFAWSQYWDEQEMKEREFGLQERGMAVSEGTLKQRRSEFLAEQARSTRTKPDPFSISEASKIYEELRDIVPPLSRGWGRGKRSKDELAESFKEAQAKFQPVMYEPAQADALQRQFTQMARSKGWAEEDIKAAVPESAKTYAPVSASYQTQPPPSPSQPNPRVLPKVATFDQLNAILNATNYPDAANR